MNAAELGHRIKEARIAKKMTQSQVVGTFITRNMLSQIENGVALPSIPTLEYLAEVLEIPDILAFSSPGEPKLQSRSERIITALEDVKAAAHREDWETVAAMDGSYPEELEDEFLALLSRAYLALAKKESDPAAAAALLGKAITMADRGLYANATVKAEAILLIQQAAAVLAAPDQH